MEWGGRGNRGEREPLSEGRMGEGERGVWARFLCLGGGGAIVLQPFLRSQTPRSEGFNFLLRTEKKLPTCNELLCLQPCLRTFWLQLVSFVAYNRKVRLRSSWDCKKRSFKVKV